MRVTFKDRCWTHPDDLVGDFGRERAAAVFRHVHVVVTANRRGKRVVNDFKSYAARRMKEAVGEEPHRFLTVAAPEGIAAPETQRYFVLDEESGRRSGSPLCWMIDSAVSSHTDGSFVGPSRVMRET